MGVSLGGGGVVEVGVCLGGGGVVEVGVWRQGAWGAGVFATAFAAVAPSPHKHCGNKDK